MGEVRSLAEPDSRSESGAGSAARAVRPEREGQPSLKQQSHLRPSTRRTRMHTSLVSPSSQIIHLVNASVDTFDALPPNLTRSISDLRELDAVLATSLDQITQNLNLLHKMMVSPEHFQAEDRLRLLRMVTDLTRAFRRAHGVEDKIRVATNTSETVSTPGKS